MPAHRTTDEAKRANGTWKPSRSRTSVPAQALLKWPHCPKRFSKIENAMWRRLGELLLPMGTISAADLPYVELTARAWARAERALDDLSPRSNPNASVRLAASLMQGLGLSPAGRERVQALPSEESEPDDPVDAILGDA